MFVNKLPTSYAPGVRCTAASAFEERYPRLRFFTAPEGGAGGDNSGTGGGSGDPNGNDGGADEQLGEGGKKALESERTARKTAETENADLKTRLKEFEDGKLTADQKLQRDAEESKGKVGQLETANATLVTENGRLRAALAEGLPVDWADRVRGTTDEEMLADAKKIKASLRDSGEGDTTEGAGARGANAPVETSPGLGTLRAGYAELASKK